MSAQKHGVRLRYGEYSRSGGPQHPIGNGNERCSCKIIPVFSYQEGPFVDGVQVVQWSPRVPHDGSLAKTVCTVPGSTVVQKDLAAGKADLLADIQVEDCVAGVLAESNEEITV